MAIMAGVLAGVVFCGFTMAAESAPGRSSDRRDGDHRKIEGRAGDVTETASQTTGGSRWYDRLHISGLIETEAQWERADYKDPAVVTLASSDVDVAAAELSFGTMVSPHVEAQAVIKYEEGDVFLDQGLIALAGTDGFPAYLTAGRQYLPFGFYESRFISDSGPLILGETNSGSVVAGYRFLDGMIDISISLFNGPIEEIGRDDTLADAVCAMVFDLGDSRRIGVSYISNIAGTDGLSGFFADSDGDGESDPISSSVGGWNTFLSLDVTGGLAVTAEYVAALDKFQVGELFSPLDAKRRRPEAWSIELSFAINDGWDGAVRLEGFSDGNDGSGEFLPESRYGVVLNWQFAEFAGLAFEYLRSDFPAGSLTSDAVTGQLAMEF